MIITNTINTDLWIRDRTQEIHAVQGDSCTRSITVKLFANREPWVPVPDVSVVIRYRKPDGTGGSYDTLPDGEKAWFLTDNAVSFILAPQMLAVPGRVAVQVEMLWEDGVLASFPLNILVEENVAAGVTSSGNYFSWEQRLERELCKTLEQAKQSGDFTGATPDLQIGKVSTLEPGEMASAAIRGTPEKPILDLALPRGEKAQVDATLAISGQAADAAAVGGALALKAPAGYGLGEASGRYNGTGVNGATKIGFYSMEDSSDGNHPTGFPYAHYGTLLVERRSEQIHQTVRRDNYIAVRTSTDGGVSWGEWEYVNPPMNMSVEYCTTGRCEGSPIYSKLINFGALPNTSSRTAEAVMDAGCSLVGIGGHLYNRTTQETIPTACQTIISSALLQKASGNLEVTTTVDASGWDFYPVLYYIKR